jgi:hypothetical protein
VEEIPLHPLAVARIARGMSVEGLATHPRRSRPAWSALWPTFSNSLPHSAQETSYWPRYEGSGV